MDATPNPPRFRWLKRLALTALLLLIALAALRLYWGHALQARVDQLIAQARAQGVPMHPDDLDYHPLSPDDNAAHFITQAFNQWPNIPNPTGNNSQRIDDTDWYLEGEAAGFTDPITDNPAYLDTCAAPLDLMRKAARLDDADWLGQPVPNDFNTFTNAAYNNLGDKRRLARLMDDAARRALQADQPELAFEIYSLIDHHADAVTARPLGLIDALVGFSIQAILYEAIQQDLPTVSDAAIQQPATRARLTQLKDQLSADAHLHDTLQQAMRVEGWVTYLYLTDRIDGSLSSQSLGGSDLYTDLLLETPILRQTFAPLFNHAIAFHLRSNESLGRLATIDNARDAMDDTIFPDYEAIYQSRPWLYPPIAELWFSDASTRVLYRGLANRRMAATAIAIRLYQADHQGQRPDTLDQLVPDYLPAVPTDPFVGDRPITYKPQGVVPKSNHEIDASEPPLTPAERAALPFRPFPLLYCVGMDYKDNGGFIGIEYDGVFQNNWSNDEDTDQWFLLEPMPDPLPTPEEDTDPLNGGEDDIDEKEDQRDHPENQASEDQPEHGQHEPQQ